MAKKKKKFRISGQSRANIISQLEQPKASVLEAPRNRSLDKTSIAAKPSIVSSHYDLVKRDIQRIGVVTGLLGLILAVLVIIDSRTHYSVTFGQKVAAILGI